MAVVSAVRSPRSGIARIARGALSLGTSDAASRASTFLVYALVARLSGADAFGQLSLALTILYVGQVFASAGLRTLVIRAVARNRRVTSRYVLHGSVLAGIAALLTFGGMVVLVGLLGYEPETATVIVLVGLTLIPLALSSVTEGALQGLEERRYITFATVIGNLGKVAGAALLLLNGRPLLELALLLVVTQSVVLTLEWHALAQVIPIRLSLPRLGLVRVLAHRAVPFLGIDSLIAITVSMTTVALSKVGDVSQVALYSAAVQVFVPLSLVYQSIVLSAFPSMCRRFGADRRQLGLMTEQIMEMLLVLALPTLLLALMLGDQLLVALYGRQDFGAASVALQILALAVLCQALTSILGQVLLAGMRERVTLRIVAVDLLVCGLCTALLVPTAGLAGAALAASLTKLVDLIQHGRAVSASGVTVRVRRAAWRPLMALSAMGAMSLVAAAAGPVVMALAGLVSYVVVLLCLLLWSEGGPNALKARYGHVWAD